VARDKFLETLRENGIRWLFTGHDHFYDRMEIGNWRWPKDYVLGRWWRERPAPPSIRTGPISGIMTGMI